MSRQQIAKCKIFGTDPVQLQHILDTIYNAFGRSVVISSIKQSDEGDLHAFVTWYTEEDA